MGDLEEKAPLTDWADRLNIHDLETGGVEFYPHQWPFQHNVTPKSGSLQIHFSKTNKSTSACPRMFTSRLIGMKPAIGSVKDQRGALTPWQILNPLRVGTSYKVHYAFVKDNICEFPVPVGVYGLPS